MSGIFAKMLNNTEAVGDDFKCNTSSFGAPSVLVGILSING